MIARVHIVILTAAISLWLIVPATFHGAPMAPIRLLVSKVQKYANADHDYYYNGGWGSTVTTKTQPSTVCCDVKIQYMGAAPIKNARVMWKMLVQPPRIARLSVAQGETTVDLQLGKNIEFQTDTVDGKALGYLCEISTNDQVLATSAEPADIKSRIDKANAP